MAFAIVACFDPEADARIRALWKELHSAGIENPLDKRRQRLGAHGGSTGQVFNDPFIQIDPQSISLLYRFSVNPYRR